MNEPMFTPVHTGKPIAVSKIRKYARGILNYRIKHRRRSMKDTMLEHYLVLTSCEKQGEMHVE